MKYTCTTIIKKPIEEVLEKFLNPESLKHWQPGFVSITPLSGAAGQVGSKAKYTVQMGKRQMELIETVVKNDLPNEFTVQFNSGKLVNTVSNHFKVIDANTTQNDCTTEFELSGMMKIVGWLMPGAFKKQTMVYMNNFKAFVEEGKSILG
jgi:carbon monoxide dehydrogenase subunit G